MTVTSTLSRLFRLGDGSTTFFPYDVGFGFTDPTDIRVFVGSTQLTYGSQYTVSTQGVTILTAPASGAVITIQRVVQATQQVNYQTLDTFPAKTHEGALDKLTYLIQQLTDGQARSLAFPSSEPSGSVNTIPDKASRISKTLGFDADGNLTAVGQLASLYLGPLAADPVVTAVGSLYFNSVTNKFRVWNGSTWSDVITSVNGLAGLFRYTATAGQTTFFGPDVDGLTLGYDPVFVNVYENGILIDKSQYTATNRTSVVFATARTAGVRITIETFGVFSLTAGIGLTLSGTTTISGPVVLTNTRAARDAFVEQLGLHPYYAHGFKNFLINGDCRLFQRIGSAFKANPGDNTYYMDRFKMFQSGTPATWSIQRVAGSLVGAATFGNPESFMSISVTTPSGSTMGFQINAENLFRFEGKTLTLSFLGKATSNAIVQLSPVQAFGLGGSPSAPVTTGFTGLNGAVAALDGTLRQFSYTFTVPSISGKTLGTTKNSDYFAVNFSLPLTPNTYQFTDFQLEEGSTATRFDRRPIQIETQLAQRFFRPVPVAISSSGAASEPNRVVQALAVPMRGVPFRRITLGDTSDVITGTTFNIFNFSPAVNGSYQSVALDSLGQANAIAVEAVSTNPGAYSVIDFQFGADAELY